MPRKIVIFGALLLAVFLGTVLVVVHFGNNAYVDIEAAKIQQRLDEKFPIQNCSLIVSCIELSTPRVLLTEGSERVELSIAIEVTVGRLRFPGQVDFSGKLRYVRYEGNLFFDDFEIREFQMSGVPSEWTAVIKTRGPAVMRAALANYPIYSLKSDSKDAALAKLALRNVEVKNGKLRITFLRM